MKKPAAAGSRQVHLNISPKNVDLFLDGRRLGSWIPGRPIQVPPGAHRLQLRIACGGPADVDARAAANLEQANNFIRDLCEFGCHFSLDDFGTGFSSLAYLKSLPIDRLKIDRAFVKDIGPGGQNSAIANAVIAMARSLNMNTIAEGVETRAQERTILDLDCAFAQGYLYARPMPEIAAVAFAADWGNCTTMQLRRLG